MFTLQRIIFFVYMQNLLHIGHYLFQISVLGKEQKANLLMIRELKCIPDL